MPDTITPPPQPKPLLQQLLSELGIGPKQTSMTPATPPLVMPQNQNSLQTPQQTGVPSVATTTPPPQPKPALPGFPTPVMGNQNVINGALPNMQAPGTTQVAPVPPAVAARERKNKKTAIKRQEGTQLRQVAKQIVDPNAPPQEAQTPFTPAQYQAPQNKGARLIAAGLEMLFGGAPIGGAAAHFLQGQNQKAKETYTRNEQLAEQQYQVAQQQAAVKFANDKIIWDNNADLRARGLNPLKRGPDGKPLPFQYPSVQEVLHGTGGKSGNFADEIAAYDRLGQLAARNGDKAAADRFANDQSVLIKQQEDARTWEKFIIQMQNQNQHWKQQESTQVWMHNDTENREDARNKYRVDAKGNEPITPQQRIEDNAKASQAMNSFRVSLSALTQPKVSMGAVVPNSQIIKPPAMKALNNMFNMIRLSKDPQGMADYVSSLTNDPNMQTLLQQYGAAQALHLQAQGRPIVPQSYPAIEKVSKDAYQHALKEAKQKAEKLRLPLNDPKVMDAIRKEAHAAVGLDQELQTLKNEPITDAGGSQAEVPFPG